MARPSAGAIGCEMGKSPEGRQANEVWQDRAAGWGQVARSHDPRMRPLSYSAGIPEASPTIPGKPPCVKNGSSVARDNQGETAATIRMRMRRGWTDGVRA